MKLTEILYEDVKEIWDDYLKHPFVSGSGCQLQAFFL